MTVAQYSVVAHDWINLEFIINDLTKRVVGQEVHPTSSPTFADITLTGDLDLTGNLAVDGTVTLNDLTASRLVATDAGKALESVDLVNWVTGTAKRVTVADDGDGTITLSGPQDLDTGSAPTFSGLLPASPAAQDLGGWTGGGVNAGEAIGLTLAFTYAGGAVDYRWRHLYLSGNLSDGTNTLTVSNAKDAYDHITANGSSHSYIDQDVTTTGTPVFANLGVGVTPAQKFEIGSADNSDRISIYHDNTDANIKWNDGHILFQTDEGTNTASHIVVQGKGTGVGLLSVYDENNSASVTLQCYNDRGNILVAGASPLGLDFQPPANCSATFFLNAAEGETQELQIYGYRTGDAARNLQIGVGIDAADTASFDGVSNYLFDGKIQAIAGGIQTIKSVADVSDPPTDAELDSAFGDPTVVGGGFVGILDDNDAGTDCYICWTTGTAGEWFYTKGTKAV